MADLCVLWAKNHVLDGVRYIGRHLENTVESSVFGVDAAVTTVSVASCFLLS